MRFRPELMPWLLIGFRLLAGPAMILLVLGAGTQACVPCAVLLGLGVASDIFDGVIARRLGSATPALRTWDSRCDLVFWLSAALAVHLARPGLIGRTWPMIATLTVMETVTHAVSQMRFRREASPHHLLSKLFGLALWALVTALFLQGFVPWLFALAFVLGVLSQLEALAITLVLPQWRCDVRNLSAALALRRDDRRGG